MCYRDSIGNRRNDFRSIKPEVMNMYAVMLDVRNDVKKEMDVVREGVRISRERAAAKAEAAAKESAARDESNNR